MDSILLSVKKQLGITAEDLSFDTDIIICINSAFMTLTQLGVGPKTGYSITSDLESWSNFLDGSKNFEAVKNFVYMSVRLDFDPPSNSGVLQAMERRLKEYEWRLQFNAEDVKEEV